MALEMIANMIGAHGIDPAFPMPNQLISLLGSTGALLQAHSIIHPGHWQDTCRVMQTIGGLGAVYFIVWFMPNTQEIFPAQAPVLETVKPVAPVLPRWENGFLWAIAFGLAITPGIVGRWNRRVPVLPVLTPPNQAARRLRPIFLAGALAFGATFAGILVPALRPSPIFFASADRFEA
jgi:hypothetical protein